MSRASDYAATQATAAAGQVTANVGEPTPLVGPKATFSVTKEGNLLVTPTGGGPNEASPAAALALAAWITLNFG
jgi:hypothetical protein